MNAWVNSALRSARELGGLSRQELAEAVNSHVWEWHGQRVEIDGHYVAKLERGVIRWPNSRYREAFRAVLGVRDDIELGFHIGRREEAPTRVTAWDVEQVEASARMFVAEQHRHGGWWLRDAALAQLRWATGLLGGDCPAGLRQPLRSAVGYLAYVCAFMCFDTSAHAEARRFFDLALRCAGNVQPLRATILVAMSRQATWLGRPDDGLTLAEQALVRADRLSAAQRAMLFATRARALGALGRVPEALRAVGYADEEFRGAAPGLEPPSMRFYDERQHLADTGEALAYVALHGHSGPEAARRLRIGVDACTEHTARSKALAQAKLATLIMATGDPVEGAALGTAAVQACAVVRSDRLIDAFRLLAHQARRHHTTPQVAELVTERLPPLLRAGGPLPR